MFIEQADHFSLPRSKLEMKISPLRLAMNWLCTCFYVS
jgi:hypothetical protein